MSFIVGLYFLKKGSFFICPKRWLLRPPETLTGSLRRTRLPPTVGSAAPILAATERTTERGSLMRAGIRSDEAGSPLMSSMSSAGVRPAMLVAPKEKPYASAPASSGPPPWSM